VGQAAILNFRQLRGRRKKPWRSPEMDEEKLGFREAPDKREEDSGWPFVNLCISNDGLARTLLEREAGTPPTNGHVIFFAKNLEKARQWLVERQVSAESTTEDSGGNRLFRFFDLDENPVEVCVEP
jgi:hypothetical protein